VACSALGEVADEDNPLAGGESDGVQTRPRDGLSGPKAGLVAAAGRQGLVAARPITDEDFARHKGPLNAAAPRQRSIGFHYGAGKHCCGGEKRKGLTIYFFFLF